MSLLENARASVGQHQRSRELSSGQRAGAWSRREVRKAQRVWLRNHWQTVGMVAGAFGIFCGLAQLVRPDFLRPYLVGAAVASAAWLVHYVMVLTSGIASKLVGIIGETWTNDQFSGLPRQGWHIVNHVMLEYRDVDHVLLGPAGFYSIETKFRSEWKNVRRTAAEFAPQAFEDAHSVAGRIGHPRGKVHALVVLWGGGVASIEPLPFEVGGVTFCAGEFLRGYLDSNSYKSVPTRDVQAAFDTLDRYVQRRDGREIALQGDFARGPADATNDVLFALATATGTLMLLAQFMQLSPTGLWGLPAAAAIVAGSVWLRRTLRSSPRVQRMTAAATTVALFVSGLLLVVWVIEMVRR
jgi:Nuclease-related domain